MNTHKSTADEQLRLALAAFEQSVVVVPDRPVPALSAFVGLLRAVGELTRFALGVALDTDRTDPMDLEPRVLRAS